MFDLVSDDSRGGGEVACGGGDVAVLAFEGVDDEVAFVEGYSFVKGAGADGVGGVGGLEGGGQVVALDDAFVSEEDGAFDAVFEFADVAGPMVGDHHVDGGGGDASDGFVEFFGVLFDEEVGEEEDVVFAVAQRGEVDGEDVEAVVEVLSEVAFADGGFEVSVGGADDADGGFSCFVGAEAFEFAFLEDAEDFDLDGGGEVADFVEEERAVVGLFDVSVACSSGAGEGAFFVAEEFAFDEGFG